MKIFLFKKPFPNDVKNHFPLRKESDMRKIFSIRLIICIVALAMALGVGIFFTYTLVLRTEYKNAALEMNEPFKQYSSVTLRKGDETFSVPTDQVEYYNMFLLDRNTAVFSKKRVPETKETITLDFGREQLSFTGLEDGSAIAITWKTPSDEKHYIVRSSTTFMQLNAYYTNCRRKYKKE